jgi:hypothetical protein
VDVRPGDIVAFGPDVPRLVLAGEEAKVLRIEGGEVLVTLTVYVQPEDFTLLRRPVH